MLECAWVHLGGCGCSFIYSSSVPGRQTLPPPPRPSNLPGSQASPRSKLLSKPNFYHFPKLVNITRRASLALDEDEGKEQNDDLKESEREANGEVIKKAVKGEIERRLISVSRIS